MTFEFNEIGLIKAGVIILSILAVYRAKGRTTPLLIFTACLSVFSFINLGAFHLPLKEKIHYWDAFHYYTGAKYFKELGYSGQYNAAYVAGHDLGYFTEVEAVRDLNTYKIIPAKLIDPPKVRARFSEERWNEFKNDVDFFFKESGRPSSAWQKLLLDHGYNAPPLKTAVMSGIINLLPLNSGSLNFFVSIDYLLLLTFIILSAIFINSYAACLFTIAFSLNPIAPFDFTFGSILRYDWFFLLGLGVLFLLKERYILSGLFIALSAHCRVFPLIFALAVVITLSKMPRELFRFTVSFGITCLTGLVLAYLFIPDNYLFEDFLSKMSIHREQVYSNTIGLKPALLADIFARQYLGMPLAESEIYSIITGRKLISNILGISFALITVFLCRNRKPVYGFIAGAVLVFMLINPVNYYYAFLAFLPLIAVKPIPLLSFFFAGQLVLYFEPNMFIQSILLSVFCGAYLALPAKEFQAGIKTRQLP